ncbi:hypothetical protein CRG98_033363 [Punica granatum]|uniref:RecQ mediated genome instability protein 1 OB-fold domain-containing protein n=1 Tax=Punica granatum TaxID=22663 RepID=A0A2I0IS16_PUNGR|nr:hypothetical protein CRG98_033363 [Punica granatum]
MSRVGLSIGQLSYLSERASQPASQPARGNSEPAVRSLSAMAETSTAAAAASSPSSSSTSDAVLQALVKRGWSFADPEHIKAITTVKCILLDDPEDTRSVAEAVESELLNLDLRSIGAKSLPDPAALRKSSHLFGPKVLQISSVRDISKSSIEDVPKNSSRRLLRLKLTDGHIEITAVEFTHIPSIPGDVVPGTKKDLGPPLKIIDQVTGNLQIH